MTYTTIKLPLPLLNEYKKRTETAQEYCEREPLYSELLEAKRDVKTKKGYKAYTSAKELFDDIS